MRDLPRLTVDEMITLVLLDNLRFRDEFEVPSEMTQEGLARATDTLRPNISRSVRSLKEKGIIEERLAHVKGHRRRKKVYMITPGSVAEISDLKERIGDLTVKGARLKDIAQKNSLPLITVYIYSREGKEIGPSQRKVTADEKRGPKLYGRSKELSLLEDWYSGKAPFAVVHGMAGVGKTALVTDFIRRKGLDNISYRFSKGGSMEGALHEIGIRLSADIGSPESLVRALGKNRLLFLDDLHLADARFRQMLSAMVKMDAPAVKIISTSRERGLFYSRREAEITGSVFEMKLPGIPESEALRLLKDRGFGEERALDLARSLGGHPVALLLAPRESGERIPDDAIDFLVEEVLKPLPEDQETLLSFLSIMRRPYSGNASFLRNGGMSPGCIDDLVRKGLIERTPQGLEVLDLIAALMIERIPPGKWSRLNRTAAEHFSGEGEGLEGMLEIMYHLSRAGCTDEILNLLKERGWEALDSGFLEILMALESVDAGKLEEGNRELYHCLKGYSEMQIGNKETAEKDLGILDSSNPGGWVGVASLEGLGTIYRDTGRSNEALGLFDRALSIIEKDEDIPDIWKVKVLNGRGLTWRFLGNEERALRDYRTALEAAIESEDTGMLPVLHYNMGQVLFSMDDLDEAERSLMQCLDTSIDEDVRLKTLETMGKLEMKRGNLSKGSGYFERAMSEVLTSGEMDEVTESYIELAKSFSSMSAGKGLMERMKGFVKGRRKEVEASISRIYDSICSSEMEKGIIASPDVHRKALELFRDLNMDRESAKVLNNLGLILKRAGDEKGAFGSFDEAIMAASRSGDRRAGAISMYNRGILLKETGNSIEARASLEKALKIFEELGLKAETELIRNRMAELDS